MAKDNDKDKQEEQQEPTPLRVFIAGADSGAGQRLIAALVKSGAAVTASTQRGSEGAGALRAAGAIPVYPDVRREGEIRSMLLMAKPDLIVNMLPQLVNTAPQIRRDYDAAVESIGAGTVNLIAAAAHVEAKQLIHISTTAIYGDQGGESVAEDAHTSDANPLYAALAAAEKAVLEADMQTIVLRAGFTYGGYDPDLRHLNDLFMASKPIFPGKGRAGFLHDDDLVEVIMQIIERDADNPLPANLYNVADDSGATADDLADTLCGMIGLGTPNRSGGGLFASLRGQAHPIQSALLNDSTSIDSSKIRADLNWTPTHPTLQSGLDQSLVIWRAQEADARAAENADTDETDENANEDKALAAQ